MIAAAGSGVVLAYGARVALATSDFTIPEGGLTVVIGPNASGKSTLLNSLTGLIEPLAGKVEVFGQQPRMARDRVAYVLQSTKVNEAMPVTVREVVAMARYGQIGLFRRFDSADRAAVDEAISLLGMAAAAGEHLTELSGGQRQRVFVAQGFAQQADLLLLDEPLTGLDLVSREHIWQAVTRARDAGRTVVVTTHDLTEAAEADHVLLLAGRVAAEGPPGDVLDPDRLSAAYGVGILHLEDGRVMLDDAVHGTLGRHVHFERGSSKSPEEE